MLKLGFFLQREKQCHVVKKTLNWGTGKSYSPSVSDISSESWVSPLSLWVLVPDLRASRGKQEPLNVGLDRYTRSFTEM